MAVAAKTMKQRLILMILSAAAITLPSCTGRKAERREAAKVPPAWAAFEEPDFIVRYPSGWELQRDVAGTRFCILSAPTSVNDVFRENVNLVTETLLEEMTLDRYAAQTAKILDGKYKIIERKKLTTGGVEYYCLKYGNANDEMEQYVFIKGKCAYILTFSAERGESEAVKKEGEGIMQSFRLIF